MREHVEKVMWIGKLDRKENNILHHTQSCMRVFVFVFWGVITIACLPHRMFFICNQTIGALSRGCNEIERNVGCYMNDE